MVYSQALNAYKETRVRTAGQGKLIIMLYDEAIKQLQAAEDLRPDRCGQDPENIEKINKHIVKTQEIITELMASLDFETGGKIAENLFALYSYFNRELLAGNIEKDFSKLALVKNMLEQLRGAWVQVAAAAPAQTAQTAAGVNVAG